jgi:hypothetical protein
MCERSTLTTPVIGDTSDNCKSASNTDQLDSDEHGQGDACDPDDDEDGLADVQDDCPTIANLAQKKRRGREKRGD